MTERKYDPDLQAILPFLPTVSDFSSLDKILEIREMRAGGFGGQPPPPPHPDVLREDRSVPGPAGAPDVPIRIYRRKNGASGQRPGVFEIHGGGFLIGSKEMMDPWCDRLVAELDIVVVSVDYRLAPEHRFPAAVEDSTAAYQWVCEHAAELGAEPGRVAVAGDSAVGNLAAVVAQWGRDHAVSPPRFQVLVYPAVDLREGIDYPSRVENAA
ncbi:alpha/beta hydrolase, partial [Myxococcota bacterium]|nr:alpha/beta hydrolase [Myxococcota bacterium]